MSFVLGFLVALASVSTPAAQAVTFEEEFPHLKKFLFTERQSNIYFGLGVSPLSIIKNKAGFGLSIFQIHYVKGMLDWEIFNGSFITTASDLPDTSFRAYTFRTAPKIKLFKILSAGPLLGLEFVNFPLIDSQIRNDASGFSTRSDTFSSRGLIYGAAISETFNIGSYTLKANQLIYRQTYSTLESQADGWTYVYPGRSDLTIDQTPIAGGWVFMLEFSFLY
jgi:hypothetical protein